MSDDIAINLTHWRRRNPVLAEQIELNAKRFTASGHAVLSKAMWRRLRGLPEPLPGDPEVVEKIKARERSGEGGCGC